MRMSDEKRLEKEGKEENEKRRERREEKKWIYTAELHSASCTSLGASSPWAVCKVGAQSLIPALMLSRL